MRRYFALVPLLLLAACQTAPESNRARYQHWAGQWNGPEATYIKILPTSSESYKLEIRDLDNSRFFDGRAVADGIEFTRDGKTETLHLGNGEDTGMKWLANKRKCVVVRSGEGYCRN